MFPPPPYNPLQQKQQPPAPPGGGIPAPFVQAPAGPDPQLWAALTGVFMNQGKLPPGMGGTSLLPPGFGNPPVLLPPGVSPASAPGLNLSQAGNGFPGAGGFGGAGGGFAGSLLPTGAGGLIGGMGVPAGGGGMAGGGLPAMGGLPSSMGGIPAMGGLLPPIVVPPRFNVSLPTSATPPAGSGDQMRVNNPPSTPTGSRQPPTPGSAVSVSQEPEWKEYSTAEGRVFWHNSRTGRSTWDKPEDFKSDFERLLSTSSAWKEYPQGDGRSYWHNSITRESEWEVPAEVTRVKESHAALDREDWSQVNLDGKCEARAKFREFLERKCVGHLGQWDSVGRVLQKDPKWNVFNSLMTTGERKHVFNEHVNNLLKKNKEELRVKKAKARDSLAEYLWRWKSGEITSLGRMPPDTLFQDLEDNPEWRILDVRERFETFEETASAVAASAIQKCSSQKAESITNWLKVCRKGQLINDDISLQELIAFVRRYYDGDLEDVNDLSIIQQWKSLLCAEIQDSPPAKIQGVFAYEKQTRARYLNLLQICEQEGILNAKTEAGEFLCQPVPLSALDDTIPPIGLSDSIDLKRQQILTRLKASATQWLEEHQKFDSVSSDSHPLCVDNRYLALFLQGGSSAQELFTDFVYTLWDLYEVVRDEAKTKITNNELVTEEQVLAWVSTLAPKYQRPGVITPLIQYCQKRLQQADGNSEKEKGEISSSS